MAKLTADDLQAMYRKAADAGVKEAVATDFARLRLDNFDRALLADCEGVGRTAADWLLALETIFRRMREQGIAGVAPTDGGKKNG